MAGSERPFGLGGPLGPWRPLDAWIAGYALLAAAVAALGAIRGVPGCRLQAAVGLAVAAGAVGLAHWSRDGRGRLPVFEVLAIDDEIRTLVSRRAPLEAITAAARRRGMGSLREDALAKARAGLTSLQEVTRVTGDDPAQGLAEAA